MRPRNTEDSRIVELSLFQKRGPVSRRWKQLHADIVQNGSARSSRISTAVIGILLRYSLAKPMAPRALMMVCAWIRLTPSSMSVKHVSWQPKSLGASTSILPCKPKIWCACWWRNLNTRSTNDPPVSALRRSKASQAINPLTGPASHGPAHRDRVSTAIQPAWHRRKREPPPFRAAHWQ